MDVSRKYGIQRYHQVSTDEDYDDLPLDRSDLFFTESTPIHTSSPYSSSKAGEALLVMVYNRIYGFPEKIMNMAYSSAQHFMMIVVDR